MKFAASNQRSDHRTKPANPSRARQHGARRSIAALAAAGLVAACLTASPAPAQDYTTERILAVARYSSLNGAADRTFDYDGKATTDIVASSDEMVNAVAPYPGGRTVVAGCVRIAGSQKFLIARYAANGGLDTTFNGTGRIIAGGTDGCAKAIAVQADGKVVVAGSSSVKAGRKRIDTLRYTASGALDLGYNVTGTPGLVSITFPAATSQLVAALAVQRDGKIIVGGSATVSGASRFAVARLTRTGGFDSTFGVGGKVVTDFASAYEGAAAIAIQADGKILVGGWAGSYLGLARYTAGGTLDTSFGGGSGKVTTNNIWTSWESIRAIAVRSDGKIVVAGRGGSCESHDGARPCPSAALPEPSRMALVRYSAAGGVESMSVEDFAPSAAESWDLKAIAIGADGKIVAAGRGSNHGECVVARYNATGSRDLTFGPAGSSGTVQTIFGTPRGDYEAAWFNAVALDTATSKIITGGAAVTGYTY